MSLYGIKPRFRQILTPVADRLAWVHPDVITAAGVGASVLALALVQIAAAPHRRWLLGLVPFALGARIACNALDGLVAQRTGKASPFGEVVNEGADRLSDVALLLGVGATPWASWAWASSATIAVLLASFAGLLGKTVGVGREYGGILGKADRMFWFSVAALITWHRGLSPVSIGPWHFRSIFEAMLAAFLPLAVLTAAQRIIRIHRRLYQLGGPRV